MAWRDTLLRHFGPGMLGGVTLPDWVRLLSDNGFAVSSGCPLRAMTASFHCVQTSIAGWFERRRCGPGVHDVVAPPPLFVLGHWRSGTIHLHNLLAVDRAVCLPEQH